MIKIRDLTFEYFDRDEEGYLTDMINAIRGINFDAKKGDFIAIAGKNGSGKSTFARILNRLLVPIEGTIVIGGLDAMDEDNTMEIRSKVGMVFQNPDDQLIGSVVEEDVAFGAANVGIRGAKLWKRVLDSLETVGLKAYAKTKINELSGGERQKIALAGVLAMKPECIILDEATSMLDPQSRQDILRLIKELNKQAGITVIMITHIMEELSYADKIYIMNDGVIAAKGTYDSIFDREDFLYSVGLELPEYIKLAHKLYEHNIIPVRNPMSVNEIADMIKEGYPTCFYTDTEPLKLDKERKRVNPKKAIVANNISFAYGNKEVLKDVSFTVACGDYLAVIGKTGSGKTTLIQQLPGLLKPLAGSIYIDGYNLWDKQTDIRKIRCRIGYVFQYPEQQLFAQNVYEDVVFGPRNTGVSEVEAEKRAYEAIKLVGLPEDVYDIPIDKLSGGQKRRVALAGILAMQPDYLILDEPVAGLDPQGKRELLEIIDALHSQAGITIVMVSHDIEGIARYADNTLVMSDGRIEAFGDTTTVLYEQYIKNNDISLLPAAMAVLALLREKGMPVSICNDIDECVSCIMANIR